MTSPTSHPQADTLIRAGTIETLQPGMPQQRSIALLSGRIIALSEDPAGLDDFIGSKTQIIDVPDSTVLPAFTDTHTHLILAGLTNFDVPVHDVKNLDELFARLKKRASETKEGEWICTATDWLEYNIKEQRLPTLKELDAVSTKHPIMVMRGGHNVVVNSVITDLLNTTSSTPSPPGGLIGKEADGSLSGLFQDSATIPILKLKPSTTLSERISGLEAASRAYAATGTACVRDCYVPLADLDALIATHTAGKLHVRVHALIPAVGMTSAEQVEALLDRMESYRHMQTDPYLSVWGVKFMVDGGMEAGAVSEPFLEIPPGREKDADCNCCGLPSYHGVLTWEKPALVEAMTAVVRRGWKIGTHAYGDRAVKLVLDVYAELMHRFPYLQPGTLVMEHGGLISPSEQIRAVNLGIATTIQHPLLHNAAGVQEVYWGTERVSRTFPARTWLDAGAVIAGGSDYPVGSFAAMRSVWGMASRETVIGVRGVEHAISVEEAVALHTTKAAELLKEEGERGRLLPGFVADLAVWGVDPLRVGDLEVLRDMMPSHISIGDRFVEI
ncbi:uncharacterized protein J4E78_009500 [Alternaria triticimaculans]|uniref:uncharacterized protein n=1 Tax=Alternaria triticimaculans TaxID=297637 RepID=UPI0020C42FD4|nr:uncharacterized protein J4E78_009500 [Alternaria triticimaculans]KAI4644681.1 hypothetical protein J4E78_009500 [Alternaria triticimaculans]